MRPTLSFATALLAGTTLASAPIGAHGQALARQAGPGFEAAQRLRSFDVQDIAVPLVAGPSELFVVRLDGVPFVLDVQPHSLLAADFQLLVQTDKGIETWPVPPTTTYRGTVVDVPGSRVYASIYDGGLRAQVVLPWQQEFWIQPAHEEPGRVASSLHLVYDRRDVLAGPETCGVGGVVQAPGNPSRPGVPPAPREHLTPSECYAIADIAFDADYEYFVLNGSSANAVMSDIVGMMNSVEAIYRDHTEIVYEIGAILVRTVLDDPYTSTSSGCGSPGILQEFQNEWNANNAWIERDVAALMTGKNLDGSIIGCANVGQICNLGGAYGINQARFSGNFSLRVALVAHELGHNWNASHCDGDPNCTIMCSSLGGCSGNVSYFEGGSDIAISSFRQGRTCLSDIVRVDASAPGPNFHGTSVLPYPTVLDGASCSASTWVDRREVRIQAGTYAEGILTLDRFALLSPVGGVVVIH